MALGITSSYDVGLCAFVAALLYLLDGRSRFGTLTLTLTLALP